MSSVFLRDVGGLAPFDCSDTAGISARWERWLRAFELFADGKGVKHADQKKALMLHTAGLSVQDIFFTLDGKVCHQLTLECIKLVKVVIF